MSEWGQWVQRCPPARMTVDGSVLGRVTLWGGMEGVTGILVAGPGLLIELQVAQVGCPT